MSVPTIYDELDNRWWGDGEILDDIYHEKEIKKMSQEDLRIAEPINDWCIVKNKKRQPKNVQVKDPKQNTTRIKGLNNKSNKNTYHNRKDPKKQNTRKYANGVAIFEKQDYKRGETKRPETKRPETKRQNTKKPEIKKHGIKRYDTKKQETKKQETKEQETKKQETKKQETKKQGTKKQGTKEQGTKEQETNKQEANKQETKEQETKEQGTNNITQKNKKSTVKKSQVKKLGTVTNVVKGGCGFIKDDDISNLGIYVFAETKKINIGDRVQFTTSQDDIQQHFQKAINVRSIKEKK